MPDPKYISINEFREFGYLQEVNRRVLHPLGLALEVTEEDDGTEYISGVWDCRDDPEGIVFDEVDKDKVERVSAEWDRRRLPRKLSVGYVVQPWAE